MKGLVLCGGQSLRMGSDKGLMMLDGQTWAQHAVDQLSSVTSEVFLSVNAEQFPVYEALFTSGRLIADRDSLQIGGPLRGVFSAHLRYPTEDWLVLACDMPRMAATPLLMLLDAYKVAEYEAYVFNIEEGIQPLCGIYTSAALNQVYRYYIQGKLVRFSMQHFLGLVNTCYIDMLTISSAFFANYNSPGDLS